MKRSTLQNIILILTLRCDQSSELMSRAEDTQLDRAERAALFFHLKICRFCHGYKKKLELMRETLNQLTQPHHYDKIKSVFMDDEHARALRGRISKKIRENLDSM